MNSNFYLSKKDRKAIDFLEKTLDNRDKSENKRSKKQEIKLAKAFLKAAKMERKSNYVNSFLVELALSGAASALYVGGDYKNSIKYRDELILMNSKFNEDGIYYSLNAYAYEELNDTLKVKESLDSLIVLLQRKHDYKNLAMAYEQAALFHLLSLNDIISASKFMEGSYYIYPSGIEINDRFSGWLADIIISKTSLCFQNISM